MNSEREFFVHESSYVDEGTSIGKQHDLQIVEDCTQALGAEYRGTRVGTIGNVGCLSFFPSKNLGCFGAGGMVVTNDSKLYEQVEMLRRHGGRKKYHHEKLGLNSRLDEIQAALLRVKLKHLDTWNERRREIAYAYNEMLVSADHLTTPRELSTKGFVSPRFQSADNCPQTTAVYHQYTVLLDDRTAAHRAMLDAGVSCSIYYPVPLHLQEVHRHLEYSLGRFPVAEDVANRCLSLPIYPELAESEQRVVANQFAGAVVVAH